MPTYHSRGVSASLVIADLQRTLANKIDLRPAQASASAIKHARHDFASGTTLRERPIGIGGSDKGVIQFIGQDEDLPLFMVEAGERLRSDARPSRTPSPPSTCSPESYLIPGGADPQALMLAVEVNAAIGKTFAGPGKARSRADNSLKTEVFLNGRLVDTHFLNTARDGAAKEYKTHFLGTRVGRQLEVPWVYQPRASGGAVDSNFTADQRWMAVASLLRWEAHERGTDKWSVCPPSAQYLMALSTLDLPERLRGKHRLGLIDVVITTGNGKKYGPECGYLGEPVRMSSTRFKRRDFKRPDSPASSVLADSDTSPLKSSDNVNTATVSRLPQLPSEMPSACGGIQSQADQPLQPSGRAAPRKKPSQCSPQPGPNLLGYSSPKKITPSENTMALAKQHGLETCLNRVLDNFQNRRRQPRTNRTVYHRLVDIQKMASKNRSAAIRDLKEQLAAQDQQHVGASPMGPLQFSTPGKMVGGDFDEESVIELSSSKHVYRDPDSSLWQKKMDTVTDTGTPTVARIGDGIAPRSPPQTTLTKGEPALPVLENEPLAKQNRVSSNRLEGLPERLSHSTIPTTALQVLSKKVELPSISMTDLCKGSSLGFAAEGVRRQVVKVRPGEFNEDELIVGIRFVVV